MDNTPNPDDTPQHDSEKTLREAVDAMNEKAYAELTATDAADLDAMNAPEPPQSRMLRAEQLIDRIVEQQKGGTAVAPFIGSMLGQLAAMATGDGLVIDWGEFSLFGIRILEPETDPQSRRIAPTGTLKLVMTAKVTPR